MAPDISAWPGLGQVTTCAMTREPGSWSMISFQVSQVRLATCRVLTVPVVFFFQAEDGIRDLTVTGVQTCALPIWPVRLRTAGWPAARVRPGLRPAAGRLRPVRPATAGWRLRPGLRPAAGWLRPEIGRASCRERV